MLENHMNSFRNLHSEINSSIKDGSINVEMTKEGDEEIFIESNDGEFYSGNICILPNGDISFNISGPTNRIELLVSNNQYRIIINILSSIN